MPKISFLSAPYPLTKSFIKLPDDSIKVKPYPMASTFSSYDEQVDTPAEFYKAIIKHSDQNHCLIKGQLKQTLENESRKNMHERTQETEWICLDFDGYEGVNVDKELKNFGMDDVSYVLQWSSSHNMAGKAGTLNCHVFMLLSRPMPAMDLKLWLQTLNFDFIPEKIGLSKNGNALKWPIDQTVCQNDKLIYIAKPIFQGIKDPLGKEPRILLVKKKLDKLPVERLGQNSIELIKKKIKDKKNELRRAIGLPATNAGTVFIGEHEVQNKPGQSRVTGVMEDDEYIRLNLDDKTSWGYWHFKENFELLFNFYGEPVYRLKEICPDYYADLVSKSALANTTPSLNGDLVLAFRDFKSAQYWNGTWNEEKQELNLAVARSEVQLDHYLQSHGRQSPPFIPIWNMEYLPDEDFIVDADNNRINMFRMSEYMRNAKERKVNLQKECPHIYKIITNLCGDDELVITEFLHWFACIFQRKGKPLTAWTFHGVEGTGKGAFFHAVASPLLHPDNCFMGGINTIEDKFNDWMVRKLFILIDEIDVDAFTEKGKVTALFRSYITEPVFPVRGMRIAPYQAANRFALMFASNRPQAVWIPPTDRRYNVGRFQQNKLGYTEEQIKVEVPKELQAFADYLHSLDTSVQRASQICHTPDRERMAKLAVTSIQETANALLAGDLEHLWKSMPDEKHMADLGTMTQHMAYASAFATLMKAIATDVVEETKFYSCLSRDEVRTIFEYCVGKTPETPNRFSSMLRHSGIEFQRMRRNKDRFEGLPVKWRINDDFKIYLIEILSTNKTKLRKIK